MKLSTRSRYGLRAALELALAYGQKPLQIKTIAKHEDISSKYLEQLMSILKTAGIVRSIRGPKGGYLLAKEPKDIKLSEVFLTLEGPILSVECLEHKEHCARCSDCVTRNVWMKIQNAMLEVLESMNMQDLVDMVEKGNGNVDFQI
jgi:Rrf2 family cysteine metabolism transcriptional repressor